MAKSSKSTSQRKSIKPPLKPIDRNGLLFLPTGTAEYDGTLILGYLLDGGEYGIHDAGYGIIDCTTEQCNKHNQLLDKMYVDGLAHCQVGQGGTFYHCVKIVNGKQHHTVATFLGHVIAETGKNGFAVFVNGTTINFQYTPPGVHVPQQPRFMFRGRLCKDQDAFNFKRVV